MGTAADPGEETRADTPRAQASARRDDPPAMVAPMALALAGGASLTSYWVVAVAIGVALIGHVSLIGAGVAIKPRKKQERIEMAIYEPPPPPKEEPPPPPPKEEPKPEPKKPKPKPKKKEPPPPEEPPPPPPSNSEPPPDTPQEPVPIVTGISMDSVVKSGNSGMKVGVGNTTHGKYDPNADRNNVKKYAGGVEGGTAKKWAPVRTSKLTSAPKVKKRKMVKYPRRIREEGIEGKVTLRVQITKDGKTRNAKLLKGVHPVLDKLALQSIQDYVWEPAYKDGKAVDTIITYVVTFDLYD
jgi:protein TonB